MKIAKELGVYERHIVDFVGTNRLDIENGTVFIYRLLLHDVFCITYAYLVNQNGIGLCHHSFPVRLHFVSKLDLLIMNKLYNGENMMAIRVLLQHY